jgi:hypothetical protein
MAEQYGTMKDVARIYGYKTEESLWRLAKRGLVPGAFRVPTGPRGRWRVDMQILRRSWGVGNSMPAVAKL